MNPATSSPVIDLLENQKTISHMGGTMRLGAYKCSVQEDSLAFKAYNSVSINERHRHRYEFNNEYKKQFTEAGMSLSGINPNGGLVEIVEIAKHPFFMGVQFHPEYKSTVENPHPLFVSFVKAALS
jgi:CTP synthase